MSTTNSIRSPSTSLPADDVAVTVLEELQIVKSASGQSHPHRKHLPEPSQQRLKASLREHPLDINASRTIGVPQELGARSEEPETLFYLAYGSNLCAETFQGKRGIRPLSAINVVVPQLVMTFDLAGLPYAEPCFANTKYRHISDPSATSVSEKTPLLFTPTSEHNKHKFHNPQWPRGLVGVVYEVTLADFAHILATEGGGASYQDVLINCHPLPRDTQHVPEKPTTAAFKAHTLYSPVYPPGEAPPGVPGRFSRPDPNYAQPSARYLKLINDGADEHSFPPDYKAYLEELAPYTITSQKQRLGGFIFRMTWLPLITAIFGLNALFADDKGQAPKWLALITGAVFRGVWISYDKFFYGMFGDGERTQERGGDEEKVG